VRHSGTVAVLLRELGQQLAALRRETWLTQENLGGLAGFSRSTVSLAEIGRQRAAACAAQEARETRALAALTAARHRADATAAGVTAAQPCPHCGCRVAVLTTLIQQPPSSAETMSDRRDWYSRRTSEFRSPP
jgi:hypothetical protein